MAKLTEEQIAKLRAVKAVPSFGPNIDLDAAATCAREISKKLVIQK